MDSKLCNLGEGEAIQMEQKFSRGYLDKIKTPITHHSDIIQTPSRHPPYNPQTSSRHSPVVVVKHKTTRKKCNSAFVTKHRLTKYSCDKIQTTNTNKTKLQITKRQNIHNHYCPKTNPKVIGAADNWMVTIIHLSPGSTQPAAHTIRNHLGGPFSFLS